LVAEEEEAKQVEEDEGEVVVVVGLLERAFSRSRCSAPSFSICSLISLSMILSPLGTSFVVEVGVLVTTEAGETMAVLGPAMLCDVEGAVGMAVVVLFIVFDFPRERFEVVGLREELDCCC